MAGAGGVNMEQFEAYFKRADLDRDGRISGAEAVSFFQGSNLPKEVLAQIWMHADQNHIGYLSRPEFYNALKLVTVAQSKRELTPEIVKAALFGPASAKIPAPRINLAATPVPLSIPMASVPSPQVGARAPPLQSSQNFGFRGQAPSSASVNQQFGQAPLTAGMNPQFGLAPSSHGMNQQFRQVQPGMSMPLGQAQPSSTSMNQQVEQLQPSSTGNQQFGQAPSSTNMNQQFFLAQGNQSMRPPLSMPTGAMAHPPQGAGSPNISTGGSMLGSGLSNSNSDWLGGKTGAVSSGPLSQVLNRGTSPSIPPVAPNLTSTFSSTSAKDPRVVGSGNGSTVDPMFGGDVFSSKQSSPPQVSSTTQRSVSSIPTSSAVVPATSISQTSVKADPFEALQSTLTKPATGSQALQTPSLPKPNQQVPTVVASSVLSSGVPAGVGASTSEQSQISWPKMTRANIQKYAKVFLDVDTDRDGRVTGEQARNLFFSWRLPREVLKQVWDLSDQDNDSALSLREFCIALYLMERYREGRTLPSTLPNSVMLDENLLSLAGPPAGFAGTGWGPSAGLRPPQGLPGAQPVVPVGVRPPVQPMFPHVDGSIQSNQQNARGSVLDNFHANQPSNAEEISFDSNREAKENNEQVENKEDVLLDSKEKLVFYRTKMQDLVLYKSRCDNRLNEITERAKADKGESELLEKKYQEKYKQVAEIHSKLTIEEASFREIQARKMELQQAIIKMEHGGSADGILQVRADRIQSDLEELLKALADRCKKFDLQIKSSALIELPPGWQPGIPEAAAIWDEEWDKFEDEGFSFNVTAPANEKPESTQRENSSPTPTLSPESVPNGDATPEKLFGVGASAFETGSVFSAEESKSPQGSPGRQAYDSPSQESSENHFRKSSDGDAETHRSFEETTWGNFDNNDDIDSVWGFNAKDSDHGRHEEKYFFGSNDFGASPDKTDSPQAGSSFQNNGLYTFEDSVPGTPVSRAGNSPSRYSIESKDPFFDNFSRYDSFGMQDSDSSPRRKNLTRFDSVSSTGGFDHSRDFSFDDSDSFASSGPFKVSSETNKKDSEKWGGF